MLCCFPLHSRPGDHYEQHRTIDASGKSSPSQRNRGKQQSIRYDPVNNSLSGNMGYKQSLNKTIEQMSQKYGSP